MNRTIVCPGCGQSVTADPDTLAQLSCPNCGKSLTRLLREERSTPAAVSHAPSASASTLRRASWAGNHPLLIATTAAASLCLIGGAVFVGYSLRGAPVSGTTISTEDAAFEQQHRSDFYALKAEAESRVLAGDLKGGHEKYRALQQLAGAHPIHDPALFDLIQDAKASQERVYGMLLTKTETSLGYYNPATENPAAVKSATTRPTPIATAPTLPPQQAYVPDAAQRSPPQPVTMPPTTEPARTVLIPATTQATAQSPVSSALPPAAVFAGHEADRQIGLALDRGIGFLISKFVNGQIDDGRPADTVQHQGLDALCVYALLHASEGSPDPRLSIHGPLIAEAIQTLKSFPLETDPGKPMSPVVYARSLRAAALAVYDRAEDRPALRADVAWLVKAASEGAYTYDDRYANPAPAGAAPGARTDPTTGDKTAAQLDASKVPVVAVMQSLDDRGNSGGPRPTEPSAPPTTPRTGPSVFYYDNGEIPVPLIPPPPPPLPTQPPPKYDPLQSETPTGPAYPQAPALAPWDNSNSQYGLLGVWSGAEAGVEVPTPYWKAVEKHWLGCELNNGQWFYSNAAGKGTLAMTCAGVSSLLVTHEWLDAPALGTRVGRPPYSPALAAGLKWLETGDNVTNIFTPELHYLGYTAYGIERCALASGFKFFGTHDWYTEIAGQILPYQAANGSWGRANDGPEALIDTSYTVLFLTRGRHPVLMNKLRVDPFWDNRPRDLANLTRFASRELERPLNWQVVSFERPWSDWMDAPILYVASHQAMKLSDDDVNKLRSYADAGGLIFTHADSGSREFNDFAADLAKKLWPQFAMQDVPATHELFSVNYHLANPPKLNMLSNGTRILMVHSPGDISPAWQERMLRAKKETFQFGVNLFVWAAGRSNFRNRLDSPYLDEPTLSPTATVNVARIKYDGAWDPEPYAWTRFARYFQWTTNQAVKTATIQLRDLKPADAPVAVITGNAAALFPDADVTAARAYVESGGTLLIDACGGSEAFAHSAEALLIAKAFPDTPLKPIAFTDPLVAGGKPNLDNLMKPAARSYVLEKLKKEDGPSVQVLKYGKGRVIYSRLDLTTGLLSTNSWGIYGYTPAYCEALVKNVLLTAQP